MKSRNGKPRLTGIFVGMASLLLVCGPAEANFEVTAPVQMVDFDGDEHGDPVLGVRITAFNPAYTESNDLIVGVPPLGDFNNPEKATLNTTKNWNFGGGCNRVIVTLSPLSDDSYELELTIGTWPGILSNWTRNDCDYILKEDPDLEWHSVKYVVDSSSLPPEKWAAFQAGLNIIQVNIASTGSSSNIRLNDFWKGTDFGFGNFNSDGQHYFSWSLTPTTVGVKFLGPDPASFTASLVLEGNFNTESHVELLFGKYTPPNQPPQCDNVLPSATTLWPPNGEFWEIGLTVPDSDVQDVVTVTVNSIHQDEPVCDSVGPEPCQPDATFVNDLAKLRAERNPTGNGRVYRIDFTAEDDRQGTCLGSVLVGVPKNRGKNGIALDDDPVYDSCLGKCP